MEIEEQRLNFSDYNAKEQEKDAMKLSNKVVYLMKIEDRWAWYHHKPDGANFRFSKPGAKIIDAYNMLSEDFPDHITNPIRLVVNPGLEEWLKARLEEVKQIERDGCLIHRVSSVTSNLTKNLIKGGR